MRRQPIGNNDILCLRARVKGVFALAGADRQRKNLLKEKRF